MRRLTLLGAGAISIALLILVLPSNGTGFAPTAGPAPSPPRADRESMGGPRGAAALNAPGPSTPSNAPRSAAPASPPAASCVPNWNTPFFFSDVCVTFSELGVSGTPNISVVPTRNTISYYVPGFYLNVTTNVRIDAANVYIWATKWPAPFVGAQPITGFDPAGWNTTDVHPMVICGQVHAGCAARNNNSATFYFDDYKYFAPGSNISFMVEVISAAGHPTSTLWSYKQINVTENYTSGYNTYPTWEVNVASPYASPTFENDILISTVPSVLTKPAFPPNPTQKLQVILTSYSQTGGAATPIPGAVLQYSIITKLGNGVTSTQATSSAFAPPNSTVMHLVTPIQPEAAGTIISFNVTSWLTWQGGAVDRITSKQYNFTWGGGGGWGAQGTAPLESNAQVLSSPWVLNSNMTYLPTATPVNITVHEVQENLTFTSGEVDFLFNDHGAKIAGSLKMTLENPNTTTVILPGLPPDSSLGIRIVVNDVHGNPTYSGFYNYTEKGDPAPAPLSGKGYLFVEVFDVSTGSLVSGAPFLLSNLTWFQNATTSRMGFGAFYNYGSGDVVQLSQGTYVLSVNAFGSSITRKVVFDASKPTTITFYVASAGVPFLATAPSPSSFAAAAVVGLAAAFAAYFPLMAWFKERRAKAEEEQRRITL